ncbi:alpha/beta hydrolase [Neotabrizicola sp. sgz301269]|uniref:alpha/beta hydrolase n=1 Tax=Neotabrizicola sp. sgz301269 TaxID=3276282 RepID=UPI00376FF43A
MIAIPLIRQGKGLALVAALAACAPAPQAPAPSPLHILTPAPVAQPESLTFLLPGALTTSAVFGPARDWGDARNPVIEYRLPGMLGQPVHPRLTIEGAAAWIAAQANLHPGARINLLAYSTGAAIAFEAAPLIDTPSRVTIAAVSPATPFPGAALAALRGGLQVVGSALATGSLGWQPIWEDYFKTLWFGKGWRASPEKRAQAEDLVRRLRDQIETPGGGRGKAQSGALLLWTLSDAARTSGARIAIFHGELDPVFPLHQVRALTEALGAELCVLQEGGHLLLQSRPELIDRIRDYLLDPETPPRCP